jgi:hypothetical protein
VAARSSSACALTSLSRTSVRVAVVLTVVSFLC